jgi:hypothetical protein
MRERESQKPRESSPRKGGVAEPLMPRRRQQTASSTGETQDAPGVRRTARDDSPARNGRDPPRRPPSGEGGAHEPSAKGRRGGRESEERVVPSTPATTTPAEGRRSALIVSADGPLRRAEASPPHGEPRRQPTRPLRPARVAPRALRDRVRPPPPARHGPLPGRRSERSMRRSSASRVREDRMHGSNGGHGSTGAQAHRA